MQVNTRQNVRAIIFPACYTVPAMKPGWLDRLIEAVEADPRSARELSRAVGGGDNFVQQIVRNRKEPSVSKLEALLSVLGAGATAYVKTGTMVSADDEEFVKAILAVPPHLREQVQRLLADIAATASVQPPSGQAQAAAKDQET